jgi:hypothetical protein
MYVCMSKHILSHLHLLAYNKRLEKSKHCCPACYREEIRSIHRESVGMGREKGRNPSQEVLSRPHDLMITLYRVTQN